MLSHFASLFQFLIPMQLPLDPKHVCSLPYLCIWTTTMPIWITKHKQLYNILFSDLRRKFPKCDVGSVHSIGQFHILPMVLKIIGTCFEIRNLSYPLQYVKQKYCTKDYDLSFCMCKIIGTPSFQRSGLGFLKQWDICEATAKEEGWSTVVCIQICLPVHRHPPGDTHMNRWRHGADFWALV